MIENTELMKLLILNQCASEVGTFSQSRSKRGPKLPESRKKKEGEHNKNYGRKHRIYAHDVF